MAVILKSLHIDCYRGISDLDLEEFNHVNILVGDNNTGKTSVMEMIYALRTPLSVNMWNEIAKKKSYNTRGVIWYNAYRNIFPIDREMQIQFAGDFTEFGELAICMSAAESKAVITERESNRINGFIRTGNQNVEDVYIDTNMMEVRIQSDNNAVEFDIYDFQRKPPREIPINRFANSIFKGNTAFLEPRDGLANDFLYLKRVILDTEYHEQLIEILKEFDPAITDIFSIEEMGSTVYYVRTNEHSSAIPISVYGDGLKKSLVLFAALASSKDGVVLVDEVETSIHTSAMSMVFSTLIRWARKLNIQLFVSTHSKEALDTLLTCDNEYSDGINVYTLFHTNQKNYVRKLSCTKALDLQNKMGMELRQ